jgi:hypothetical protein
MLGLSAGSGGDADGVVLAVVVGIIVASSGTLSVGIMIWVVGAWCRGWGPLLLERQPWWGQTAGSLSARAALLQHRLALAVLKRILALSLNHDRGIYQRLKVSVWNNHKDTLHLIMQTIQKAILLLLFGVGVFWSIPG